MRVDKWIWAMWIAKSRTEGTEMCTLGRVMVNGEKAKPAKFLKIGDIVQAQLKGYGKRYKVVGFLEKRGSQEMALRCFEDVTPPDLQKDAKPLDQGVRDKGTGRPTKKERRQRDQVWE